MHKDVHNVLQNFKAHINETDMILCNHVC